MVLFTFEFSIGLVICFLAPLDFEPSRLLLCLTHDVGYRAAIQYYEASG